jgi:hypothetical protein
MESRNKLTFVKDIDILAKLVVVDFIRVSVVHIFDQDQFEVVLSREKVELVQNSRELAL